mmetsp:Transcript_11214/g.11277  ORF Transcript_11214/g.11277 Transcript_11214/m.11277 type:complete len:280 (+) Transcript_11214:918-1757(+)
MDFFGLQLIFKLVFEVLFSDFGPLLVDLVHSFLHFLDLVFELLDLLLKVLSGSLSLLLLLPDVLDLSLLRLDFVLQPIQHISDLFFLIIEGVCLRLQLSEPLSTLERILQELNIIHSLFLLFFVECLGFVLLLEHLDLCLDLGWLLVVPIDILLEVVALLLDGVDSLLHLIQLFDVLPLLLFQGHCPINLFLEVVSIGHFGVPDSASINVLSLLEIDIPHLGPALFDLGVKSFHLGVEFLLVWILLPQVLLQRRRNLRLQGHYHLLPFGSRSVMILVVV